MPNADSEITKLSEVDLRRVAVVDEKFKIVHCNPEMQNILGITASEILGGDWNSLQNVKIEENYILLKAAFADGKKAVELNVQDKGKVFWLRTRPILNSIGTFGAVFLLRDMTENVQQAGECDRGSPHPVSAVAVGGLEHQVMSADGHG